MFHYATDRYPEEARADNSELAPRTASFAVNGRFLTQPVTGVQRYAREILGEIDQRLSRTGERAQLIVPPGTGTIPAFQAIGTVEAAGGTGHLWEQGRLPLGATMPLLNLCNTGPLAVRRQVVCVHDANVFDAPGSYSLAFRSLYRVLIPGLAHRAMRITSVSKSSAERLAHHTGIAMRSIEVMYNGHEHVFRWNPAASTLGSRIAALRPFILLLGSRAQHKNAAFILRQAAELDAMGLDLVVAGGSADIFAQTAAVEASNIHYLGFVTDDDLALLYAHALCLAFPSRSEGFGIPLVEAMALGCPIVSSDRSCMPEICGDATLLADPDDAPAWQGHFRALVQSAGLREDLRARGLERVKLFSWQSSAQAYLGLLSRL